jgi:hypothetical protein
MKHRLTYSWVILLSLLAFSCEKPSDYSIPSPDEINHNGNGQDNHGSGNNEGQQGQQEPHPWDANRGKVVLPHGEGWSSASVTDGITYYSFAGKEPVSKAMQRIFVADIDMSKGKYKLGMTYNSTRSTTSTIFKNTKALVAMNGGYELASIVIKIAGSYKSCMPNNNIGDTDVPNWKNEGALYFSDGTDPRIRFDGKDLSITAQRNFYYTSKEQNILTSAPMLVNDFEPVGQSFVWFAGNLNSLNYEDPQRHQGVRHPRTVIATTENNHLLMIVIDGRRSGISEGMSAKEVTGFLVSNFNPQYALNLDGGGSSSICISGQGNAETHLVNYPVDDDTANGERKVTSHLYIVAK